MRCTRDSFDWRFVAAVWLCGFLLMPGLSPAVAADTLYPALNLDGAVPCGEWLCYPDLNAPQTFAIEPSTLHIVKHKGVPRLFLIRSAEGAGEGSSFQPIPKPGPAGILYVHLKLTLDDTQIRQAQDDLRQRFPDAQITGQTPLAPGVLALVLQDQRGTLEWLTRGRTSAVTADEMMALFELNAAQMEKIEGLERQGSRLVFALETGVPGWIPPQAVAPKLDVSALKDKLVSAGNRRWSGSELLTALGLALQNDGVVFEPHTSDASLTEYIKAYLATEWFSPAPSLASFESTSSATATESLAPLIEWILQSLERQSESQAESQAESQSESQSESRSERESLPEPRTESVPQPEHEASPEHEAQPEQRNGAVSTFPFLRRDGAVTLSARLFQGWALVPIAWAAEETKSPLTADKSALWRLAQKANDDGAEAYESKDFDAATSAFSRAGELYVRIFGSASPAIEYNLAQSFRRMGECPQAIVHYERVIDALATSDEKEYPGYIGYSLLFLAQCLIDQKRSADAINYLYRAVQIPATPEKGRVLIEVGETFYRLKQYCPALETYRAADRLIAFDEATHSGRVRERFEQIAQEALDDIRGREKRLTKASSIEALRRVVSEYRDYLLCARPVETQEREINARILSLEAKLSSRAEPARPPTPAVVDKTADPAHAVNAASVLAFSAIRPLLNMETYRYTHPGDIPTEPVALARWQTSQRLADLRVVTAKQFGAVFPATDAVWVSLVGQNETFFAEYVERVDVFLRRRSSAEGEPPIATLAITPERLSHDANLFRLVLPEPEPDTALPRYDVKAVWYYRQGSKVELPWRHLQSPWLILESPHRERVMTLTAERSVLEAHAIESVRLVFHSQLDAQEIRQEVTLSSQAPFLSWQVRFPVGIRPVPIEVEGHWQQKDRRLLVRRRVVSGRHFDWSDLPATSSGETPSAATSSGETPSAATSSGETPSAATPSGETPSGDTH